MNAGVLVVDDDSSFRVLARRLLETAGMTVAGEAGTVRGALDAVRVLKPSGVLLDVGLPDGDGITLAGELTTLPGGPRIILTSSDATLGTAETVRRSGAAAFVPKEELSDVPICALFDLD